MCEFSDWHPENKNAHVSLSFICSISPSSTFGNRYCHITRIDGRSGNEPKLFSPVLLYNANVFLSHIPKYANHQLQHTFSGSYTYLPKFLQTFLKKSLRAHTLLQAPGFLSSHNSPAPSFVISSPLEEGASSPGWGARCEEPGRAGSPPPAPQPTARLEPPPAGAVSTRMKCSWGGPRRHSLRHEKGWKRPPQSAHGPSPLTGYHTPGPCCPAG